MTHGTETWRFFGTWHLSVLILVIGIAAVVWLRIMANHRTFRELIPWSLAIVVSMVLLSSNVQATAMTSYRSHMIEHLIVILIVAPLVAGGMRWRLSRSGATCALLAFTVLVPLYHLTRMGAWVMQQQGGHVVELVSFFIVGVWFWLPVYGVNRAMTDLQRITFTFIALPVIATTGLVLWSADSDSLSSVGMAMPGMTLNQVRVGGLAMIEWGSALMIVHLIALMSMALHQRRGERVPVGFKYAEI